MLSIAIAPALVATLFGGDQATRDELAAALERAGENRVELEQALEGVPGDQQAGLRWLLIHMPARDLETLSADFLLENCDLAYAAWRGAPWGERIDEELFFDGVLPYASVNERRDRWRADFSKRLAPLVAEAETPAAAAAILNNELFGLVGVKYSTGREKPDQSPLETMESGLASCTGLSILLIDACRAVGVPARFVGTPLWSDESGNHSWVEVWDDGWHFTGAAEPTGAELDRAWFTDRAAGALRDDPRHAIYAVTWRRSPLTFPMVWLPEDRSVPAVNVTDRYAQAPQPLKEGYARVRFRVLVAGGAERRAVAVRVADREGELLFEGTSKDEGFDANDHLTAHLPLGAELRVAAGTIPGIATLDFTVERDEQLVTLRLGKR